MSNNWKETYDSYKEILVDGIIPSNKRPQAYLVGGQPGSGKSFLINEIKKSCSDTIFINGDHIRTYYPNVEKLSLEEYPIITQPFVNYCVERLIDELSDEKYNLIIEGTLRDKNVPLKTASLLKDKGYNVELQVMAVSKEVSWQSTLDRYEELRKAGAIPRTVDKEKHDAIVKILPVTVKELNLSDRFDNILIMTREHEVLYDRKLHKGIREPDTLLREELNSGLDEPTGHSSPGDNR